MMEATCTSARTPYTSSRPELVGGIRVGRSELESGLELDPEDPQTKGTSTVSSQI